MAFTKGTKRSISHAVSSIATVCSICSLSGVAILKHQRAELWELKMLISDWFIFNWSQGTSPTNLFTTRDQAKYCGDQSLRLVPRIQTSLNSWDRFRGPKFSPCDRILTKIGLFTRWDLVAGTGPCDRSLRPSPLVCADLNDQISFPVTRVSTQNDIIFLILLLSCILKA